jgi:hypothetical protein
MSILAASGKFSGAALHCTYSSGSINHSKFLLSSHLAYREKFLLKKLDVLSNKTLLSFGVMEEYPTVTLG